MGSKHTKDGIYGLILVLIYALSRILFILKGGSFLATPLSFAKQYLDPTLLATDLLNSTFYLHSQPPLFNLFLGLVLKVSPLPSLSFEILFKTTGVLLPLLLFGILTKIGIKSFLAFIATIIFMLNPTLILYENLLYYTYIEAFCVLLAVFLLLHWTTSKEVLSLILFWTVLLCLGMIRSLFHPAFFLLTALSLTLFLSYRGHSRSMAKKFFFSSLIVLIPLSLLCVKNAAVYGFFGTSSWDGMSLWIKANGYAPEQLEEFYRTGTISREALRAGLDTFQPISHFYGQDELNSITCHHEADCNEWKSTGKPNFNHSGYVYLSRQLWQDASSLIVNNPTLFGFYTFVSYGLMLWHASDSVHALFMENMQIVEPLENIYRFLYFGFMGVETKLSSNPMWWVRTALISVLFLFFYLTTLMAVFLRNDSSRSPIITVCLFCLLIHAYTLCVSSLIEFGENNRFRFPVDAAFLVLVAGNIVIWGKSLADKYGKPSSNLQ